MSIPTPHNSAKKEDFAKTVIMPGDPKRSEYIANKFLTDVKLINDVRGIKGYTGFYKGKKVSVMAHGMGMPSIAIYAHELFNFYDVDTIIRVGSCGGIGKDIKLRDVVLADPAVTDSNIGRFFPDEDQHYAYPDKEFADKVRETAKKLNINLVSGMVMASDMFYYEREECLKWKEKGAIACEMESYILYLLAKQAKKKAACLLTVADLFFEKVTDLTSEEREKSLDEMITLALEAAE